MNCPGCGQWESDADADFCGQCGTPLNRCSAVVVAEPAGLDEALMQLASLLEQQAVVPQQVCWELLACAGAEPHGNQPTIVVMGEYRRGKSTVINRLLGQAIAPTALKQDRVPLRICQTPTESSSWKGGESSKSAPTNH